jgi:hypothetical protein
MTNITSYPLSVFDKRIPLDDMRQLGDVHQKPPPPVNTAVTHFLSIVSTSHTASVEL